MKWLFAFSLTFVFWVGCGSNEPALPPSSPQPATPAPMVPPSSPSLAPSPDAPESATDESKAPDTPPANPAVTMPAPVQPNASATPAAKKTPARIGPPATAGNGAQTGPTGRGRKRALRAGDHHHARFRFLLRAGTHRLRDPNTSRHAILQGLGKSEPQGSSGVHAEDHQGQWHRSAGVAAGPPLPLQPEDRTVDGRIPAPTAPAAK